MHGAIAATGCGSLSRRLEGAPRIGRARSVICSVRRDCRLRHWSSAPRLEQRAGIPPFRREYRRQRGA